MFSQRLTVGPTASVVLTSEFVDGLDIFKKGFDEEFGGSVIGHTWSTAESIVRSGASWPGWSVYFSSLRSAYLMRLGVCPEYRHRNWPTEKARKTAMWEHNERAFSLGKTRYIPDGVPMPDFIEGGHTDPSIFRKMAEKFGVSMDDIHEYFLKSFNSTQFFFAVAEYSIGARDRLTEAGILRKGKNIPIRESIFNLTMSEARSALKMLGVVPENTKQSNQIKLASAFDADKQAVADVVGKTRIWDHTYWVSPPPGLTWSDFQSLRQQVKGMAVAIGDLHVSSIKKKYIVDRMRLQGYLET